MKQKASICFPSCLELVQSNEIRQSMWKLISAFINVKNSYSCCRNFKRMRRWVNCLVLIFRKCTALQEVLNHKNAQ